MAQTAAPSSSECLPTVCPGGRGDRNRWVATPFFLGSSAILLLATYLGPGYGLHEAFGYPVCGFKITSGLPCISCGMTTAFAYAADGNLLGALRVQPFAALLAVATAVLAIVSGYALVSGMSLAPIGRAVWRPRVIIPALVLLVASWVYTLLVTLFTGASPA